MRLWIQKVPQRLTEEMLIDDWISLHREGWFQNPRNGLYGYEQRYRAIAEHWLKKRRAWPRLQRPRAHIRAKLWDEFVAMFEEEKREASNA